MKVVFDTNIYLSALITPGGKPARILELARKNQFQLYLCQSINSEIKKILVNKLGYSEDFAEVTVQDVLKFSTIVKFRKVDSLTMGNLGDDQVVACAIAAQADFLITGDRKHILPLKKVGKCNIVTAAEFLTLGEDGAENRVVKKV